MGKVVRFITLMTVMLGFATTAVGAQPIVIGAINPLTGPNDFIGVDQKRGQELAKDEINEMGGVLGRVLKIIHEDSESRPEAGITAAHKLVDVNRVPLILGVFSSGVTLPIGAYTNEQGIVQINVASTSPKLREVGSYFFSIMGLDELMGSELANFAMEDTGQKKFSILVPNNPYGIGMRIWMKKTVEEAGGEILDVVEYELFKTDYRAELQRLFAHNPPAILYTAYGKESRILHKQAYELGLYEEGKWYGGYITMCVGDAIPETAEGVKGLAPAYLGPAAEHFRKAFKEKYGEDPASSFSAYAYDSAWVAAIAINFAGTTDADAVRKALYTASRIYSGASGGGDKTFDKDGMQATETYQTLIYRKGEYKHYEVGK